MDNVTHGIVGVALAVPLVRPFLGRAAKSNRSADKKLILALFLTAILGNNAPDLDFVLPRLFGDGGSRLSYLVHHRGFTHTLAAAPLLGALTALFSAWIAKVPLRKNPWLVVVGVLSCCLHVFADSWNNYGVHPFWPFVNSWFYGDFIFILEPLLWLSFLPFCYFYTSRVWVRRLCAGLGVFVLALAWLTGYVWWVLAAAITLFAALQIAIQRKRSSYAWALISLLAVLTVFFVGSRVAKSRAGAFLENAKALQGSPVSVQVITSPEPANPLCWQAMGVVQRPLAKPASSRYQVWLGVLSLWPALVPPEKCFLGFRSLRTSPLEAVSESAHGLRFLGKFTADPAQLWVLKNQSCVAEQFLRFSRAPFWMPWKTADGGNGWLVGDMRYDREPGLGFAEFIFSHGVGSPTPCLRVPAPWAPPFR